MSGQYDRWGGGGPSRFNSYGGRGRCDDDDAGGFGSSSRPSHGGPRRNAGYREEADSPRYNPSSQSLPIEGSRGRDDRSSGGRVADLGYGRRQSEDSRYGGYSGGGRGAGASGGGQELTRDEYDQRMQIAHRRMEESSGSSLRVLHETVRMGVDTAEELEVQAETLDRVERRLDEMEVDLDQSKRHMRNIKSPFGGIGNYFSRRKKVNEITDPKMPKGSAAAAMEKKRQNTKGAKEHDRSEPAGGHKTTGNDVVDGNLDQMERALHQLKGIGVMIGDQLDDSEVQIERVAVKMDRGDVKIKKINRDIKREL